MCISWYVNYITIMLLIKKNNVTLLISGKIESKAKNINRNTSILEIQMKGNCFLGHRQIKTMPAEEHVITVPCASINVGGVMDPGCHS